MDTCWVLMKRKNLVFTLNMVQSVWHYRQKVFYISFGQREDKFRHFIGLLTFYGFKKCSRDRTKERGFLHFFYL